MRRFLMVALATTLAGCVSAQGAMIDNRTAIISGRGSAYASGTAVLHKSLIEAATMAQARGFEYFQVVNAQDASSSGAFVNPGYSTSNTYGRVYCGQYVCNGNSTTTTTTSTPTTYIPYARPGADLMIRFYHEDEIKADMLSLWRAADVLSGK